MNVHEKKGDTCAACEHNRPSIPTCSECGRSKPYAVSMPYCFKNKFWIYEEQGGPCQFFKRAKYIDLRLMKGAEKE